VSIKESKVPFFLQRWGWLPEWRHSIKLDRKEGTWQALSQILAENSQTVLSRIRPNRNGKGRECSCSRKNLKKL
jgi:hypothetical protein